VSRRVRSPGGGLARGRAGFAALLAACLALPCAAAAAAQEPVVAKLDAFLRARLAVAPQLVAVLVEPAALPAPQRLAVPGPGERLPKADRHVRAVTALRANAERAQAGVLAALREAEATGAAREVEPLWIANLVRAEVTPALLAAIAARPDVARVRLDRAVALAPPPAGAAGAPTPAGTISQALEVVRVPGAWDAGFTGRGILVANLDSGVQGSHPALAEKWRGLRVPVEQAWFDPFRNSTFPVDDDPASRANGHGTGTMGILVGGERTVGVAFEAEWIAGNIFENNQSFISTILKGLQWAADPDGDPATAFDVPDVINASFGLAEVDPDGLPTDTGLCDDVFDEAVAAARTAGAVVVFSAGNFDVPDPGDITSPASSPGVFAVGAVDLDGDVAGFSGVGPSLCESPDPTKPDVVAPGVAVRTLNRNGGEQFLSGTSFAAPIAGGIAALVRQKDPLLPPADVEAVLKATAVDLGAPGADNTFGRGRVDALAALDATDAAPALLRLTGFERQSGATSVKVAPGGAGAPEGFFLLPGENRFAARVVNPTAAATSPGTATLSSRTELVEVVDGSAEVPGLAPGAEAALAFAVRLAADAPPGRDLGLDLSLPGAGGATAFTLVVGEPVEGRFATHDVNDVRLTVTNFGALGFWLGVTDAAGRRNELIGDGFHFPADDPENRLFHGSFVIGRSPTQVSDDMPYGNVTQSVNDFHVLPGVPFTFAAPGPVAAQQVTGAYDDSYNLEGELGVSVTQRSYAFTEPGRRDFVILTFDVANRTPSALTNLHAGLFADWDFLDEEGDPQETMDFVPAVRLGTVTGAAGAPTLGVVALNDVPLGDVSYRIVELADFQAGGGGTEISEADKFEFLSEGVPVTRVGTPQDLAHLIAFGPETLAPGDSFQAAFALVGGADAAAARDAASRARAVYDEVIRGVEPPPPGVPEALVLENPFPNPLRPGEGVATLRFALPAGADGSLEPVPADLRVLDIRGRIVRVLAEDDFEPGEHESTWDGLDADGRAVPSGVYAVLLESGGARALRKLVVVR
jgi:hypothetical protein